MIMRQEFPLSPFLFNIALKFQARTVTQEEKNKGIQIRKEIVKLSVVADDMVLNLKDSKKFTKIS
jgi:hypothetical protein